MMRTVVILAIRFYQACLSPVFGGCCRFWPTCSEYAIQAVRAHGTMRGLWLAARRLARCHPLRAGGYDPVPQPSRASHGDGKSVA